VKLTQCPYDGTPIDIEHLSGGSILLACPTCEAHWEQHGAWLGRVREPDWQKVIAKRRLPTGDEHPQRTHSR